MDETDFNKKEDLIEQDHLEAASVKSEQITQAYFVKSKEVIGVDFKSLTIAQSWKPLAYSYYELLQSIFIREGRLFVINHIDAIRDKFYEYDFDSHTLMKRENLLIIRYKVAMTEIDDNFVACVGGLVDGVFFKNCEIYDVMCGRWSKFADLNQAKSNVTTVYFAEIRTLYAFGGLMPGKRLNSIECIWFDEEFDGKWELLNPKGSHIFNACSSPSAIVVKQTEVLLFGGVSPITQLIRYDTMKNQLTSTDITTNTPDQFPMMQNSRGFFRNKHYFVSTVGTLNIFNGNKWVFLKNFVDI